MIIVLKQHAPADKVQAFCKELNSMGYQINDSVGSDTHILGSCHGLFRYSFRVLYL